MGRPAHAGVTRVRTALKGSRGFILGGGLAFSDTATGLLLQVHVRKLVVHQAEGCTDRGMSLSFRWNPSSSLLDLTATVAPSWGGQATGGAEALWGNQMAHGMGSHQMHGAGGQLNAEVGYGLPVGARFVGTPRFGLRTSPYGRDYQVGYGLGVQEKGKLNLDLRVEAQRRESCGGGRGRQRADGPGDARLVGGVREERAADAVREPSWPASSTGRTDTTSMTRAI